MKFSPHEYQRFAIDFILKNPVAALLLDMGLGKTVTTLTAIAELLFNSFEVHKVLVVAPLRVARNTWSAEIEKWDHLKDLKYSIVVGTEQERKAALQASADIYIINRENVEWLVEKSGAALNFDMLVIDELSSFKNHQTKRFKALMKIRPMFKRVVGLNIDMIVTKSISRFARNTLDCLKFIRLLKEKNIPVFFEKENINTMDTKGEVLLTIMASLAQQESQSLSQNVKLGLQYRYQNGQVQVNHNRFLGYTKDENGHLIIEPSEAEIVKRIYREYLQGSSLKQIGDGLEADGILTAAGNRKWRPEALKKILQNEKYIGDALLQKTYTVDFLTKKRVKNNGIVPQYYVTDNHEAIIPRDLFMQVQEEMQRRANLHSGKDRKKRVYSSKYALSSIVYCSKCGDIFRRIVWNNRGKHSVVWRCVTRIESGPNACDADTIQETELQEAVVKAINSILARKSTAIGVLQENIEEVLKQENSPAKDIDSQLEELQKQLLQKANKNEQYDSFVEQIYKLREEKQKILSDKAEMEGIKQSIYNMKAFLNSQTTDIEEFDEVLVRRLVEKVTVYDDRFEVELKSKLSVDITRKK